MRQQFTDERDDNYNKRAEAKLTEFPSILAHSFVMENKQNLLPGVTFVCRLVERYAVCSLCVRLTASAHIIYDHVLYF